jgi:hypothetical protein
VKALGWHEKSTPKLYAAHFSHTPYLYYALTMTSSLSKIKSHPDAWEYAVQSYLASLSSAERKGFTAPTSADDCLAQIRQAQAHKKGFNRLMTTLRPIIEPLKRFEGAIDVLVQTNGGIASPIWGPLRVVITVCQ